MIIKNKSYELCQRMTLDVLDLSKISIDEQDPTNNILVMIQILSDSVKAAYKKLSWTTSFSLKCRYFKFRKASLRSKNFIMKNLNLADILKNFTVLMELEGTPVKKKLKPEANLLEDKLPKA